VIGGSWSGAQVELERLLDYLDLELGQQER
jgi:hypothetical protein